MLGASGAFSALAEASKSGPSPGGRPEGGAEAAPDGGAEAAPESRLGFGGGASLRDSGGAESCTPAAVAASGALLVSSARGEPSGLDSDERVEWDEPDERSSVGCSRLRLL